MTRLRPRRSRRPIVVGVVGALVFSAVGVAGFVIGASGVATRLIATIAGVIGVIGAMFLLASALIGRSHHCPGCPDH